MNNNCFISALIYASYPKYKEMESQGLHSDIKIMIACGWLNGLHFKKQQVECLSKQDAINYVLAQVDGAEKAEIYAQAYGQNFHVLFQETEHKKVKLTVTLLGDQASPLNLVVTAKVFLGLVERYTIEELQGFKEA